MTDPRTTYHGVQYLRALAAAAVVFHHVSYEVVTGSSAPAFLRAVPEIPALGASGVDVFFVISGFIIFATMPTGQGAGPAAAFMGRRLLRVMPLYWVWTSALVLAMAGGVALRGTPLGPAVVAASYALVPYEVRPGVYHPLLDPGWTLSFEMYFYLAAAATIACLPVRRRLAGLLAILLCVQVAASAAPSPEGVRRWLGSPLVYEFLAGAALAAAFRSARHRGRVGAHPRLGGALVGAGALGLAGSACLADPTAWRLAAWGVPAVLVVAGAVLADAPARGPATRLLFWLGAASYSLYLSHYLATIALGGAVRRHYLDAIAPDALAVCATVAIVALGSATHAAVERPLLALLRRTGRAPSAVGIAA